MPEADNLDDAIEIIASLRATVDEQAEYINVLENLTKQPTAPVLTRRDRLVEAILPVVVQKFTMRSEGIAADHDRLFICSTTIKLVDQMIREMGEEG